MWIGHDTTHLTERTHRAATKHASNAVCAPQQSIQNRHHMHGCPSRQARDQQTHTHLESACRHLQDHRRLHQTRRRCRRAYASWAQAMALRPLRRDGRCVGDWISRSLPRGDVNQHSPGGTALPLSCSTRGAPPCAHSSAAMARKCGHTSPKAAALRRCATSEAKMQCGWRARTGSAAWLGPHTSLLPKLLGSPAQQANARHAGTSCVGRLPLHAEISAFESSRAGLQTTPAARGWANLKSRFSNYRMMIDEAFCRRRQPSSRASRDDERFGALCRRHGREMATSPTTGSNRMTCLPPRACQREGAKWRRDSTEFP